ncbi:hypothetical protein AMECASPLE_028930 [Ameca splendens]|uniref:Uncharacterized protein n=1 Tax=Ameca splendens TaxID=208324 RepID=A0ABV0ZRE4_9TELE
MSLENLRSVGILEKSALCISTFQDQSCWYSEFAANTVRGLDHQTSQQLFQSEEWIHRSTARITTTRLLLNQSLLSSTLDQTFPGKKINVLPGQGLQKQQN